LAGTPGAWSALFYIYAIFKFESYSKYEAIAFLAFLVITSAQVLHLRVGFVKLRFYGNAVLLSTILSLLFNMKPLPDLSLLLALGLTLLPSNVLGNV